MKGTDFNNPSIQRRKAFAMLLFSTFLFIPLHVSIAQTTGLLQNLTTVKSTATFLTIAPDGRSSGMGDVGVATAPDVNSQYWNSAKYAFIEGKSAVAINHTPWKRNLIPGVSLNYLSGYFKISDKSTISTSFSLFILGEYYMNSNSVYRPFELAADVGYIRKFTDHFSGGLVFRYIHSDPYGGMTTAAGEETMPGQSLAGDLGLYYQNHFLLGERNTEWALGLNISNAGTPISYTADADKTPIPTNLRLGGRISFDIDQYNTLSFHSDLNKLLVPTSPVYTQNDTGDLILVRGMEAPESIVMSMIQSLYDAPGVRKNDEGYSVLQEELNEVAFSFGAEYWYNNAFAIRSGYFHQHSTKGNRQYFSLGLGGSYSFLTVDISYLMPVNGQNSPLANTLRFTLIARLK